MVATDSATRRGSSRSSGSGRPLSIWQNEQLREQVAPPIRNVASRSSQHSKMFGHPASSQTVCKPSPRTSSFNAVYCGPIRARVLIHSGFFSIGTAALRASTRSSLRPSGATVLMETPCSCRHLGWFCRAEGAHQVEFDERENLVDADVAAKLARQ